MQKQTSEDDPFSEFQMQFLDTFPVNHYIADFTLTFLQSGTLQDLLNKHDFTHEGDFSKRKGRFGPNDKNIFRKKGFMNKHELI